jgi:hypothetical protein
VLVCDGDVEAPAGARAGAVGSAGVAGPPVLGDVTEGGAAAAGAVSAGASAVVPRPSTAPVGVVGDETPTLLPGSLAVGWSVDVTLPGSDEHAGRELAPSTSASTLHPE